MRFRRRFFASVLISLFACLLLGLCPLRVSAQSSLHVHNLNTGISYSTIQEALDDNATLDGHVISVDAGIYYELVNVSKAVSLMGEDPLETIIDGQGNGTVVTVQAADVEVTGFNIRNSSALSGSAGVEVLDSVFCNVSGNIVQENCYGIWLQSCGSTIVSGNTFVNNSNGVYADSLTNSFISGNIFTSNDFAVWLSDVNATVFQSNNVSKNNYAVWITQSANLSLSENSITYNSDGVLIYSGSSSIVISDNTIYTNSSYAVFMNAVLNSGVTNNHISSQRREAIYVQNSNNSNFTGNSVVSGGYDGVFLELSNGNLLDGNIVTGGKNAIEISSSINNVVSRNDLHGNSFGIFLGGVDESEISQNRLMDNGNGIGVTNSRSVWIEENNLTGNVNDGIHLTLSRGGSLINNTVFDCGQAILLTNSSDALVTENDVRGCGAGLGAEESDRIAVSNNSFSGNSAYGIFLKISVNSTLANNDVEGSTLGIGLEGLSANSIVSDNSLSNCVTGIRVEGSADDFLVRNNVSECTSGAVLLNSHNVTVVGNNFLNNDAGFVANASNGNFVYSNILTHNGDGLTLWQSNNNTVELNIVSLSLRRGIDVSFSDFNFIVHNGFFNNSLSSASLNSSNSWDDGIEGNFWGYDGFVDSDRNGVADSPFVLGDGEKDNFPLMGEYTELSTIVNGRQYTVGIVSNSSVSDLRFIQTAENASALVIFRVSEVEGMIFCRVGVPRAMALAPFDVTIDNNEPSYQNIVGSNGTHTWVYFSFPLGGDVRIVTAAPAPPFWAEFWFWGITVLGIVVAILTYAIFLFYRRLTAYRRTVEEVERKLRERESSPLEVARRKFSSDVERRSVKIGEFEEKYGVKIRPRESLDAIFRVLEKKNKGGSEEDDDVNT
jgi:parallel beta-helix repeat protein